MIDVRVLDHFIVTGAQVVVDGGEGGALSRPLGGLRPPRVYYVLSEEHARRLIIDLLHITVFRRFRLEANKPLVEYQEGRVRGSSPHSGWNAGLGWHGLCTSHDGN